MGWAVGWGLEYAIGRLGGYIAAVALLIVGVVLFVGRSAAEAGLVLWMGWEWLRGQWQLWQEDRALRRLARQPEPDYTINHRGAERPRQRTRPGEAVSAQSAASVQPRVIGGLNPGRCLRLWRLPRLCLHPSQSCEWFPT